MDVDAENTFVPNGDSTSLNDMEKIIETKHLAEESFIENDDDFTDDIEVIEIKMNEDESDVETEDLYDDSSCTEDIFDDIENININVDPFELPLQENDDISVKDEKLDSEEMAILQHDLENKVRESSDDTDIETEKTVKQPSPAHKIEKSNKPKHPTVCRICGKFYVSRTSYLRHLLSMHSFNPLVAKPRKPLPAKRNGDGPASSSDRNIGGGDNGAGGEAASRPRKASRNAPRELSSRIMCDVCGKTFRFASSYRKHVRDFHGDGPPRPKPLRTRRMCDLCGKLCSGGSFKGHMKKHTNPESVTCPHCDQLFSFESVLKSHIKVRHSTERPFQCELCDSRFKRADYLRSHMRYKHEPKLLRSENKSARGGGRPPYQYSQFRCEDCDTTFRNQESLNKHHSNKERMAEGEGGGGAAGERKCPIVFQCDVCHMTFRRRNYLMLHKRYVHDKQQPFSISEASIGPYKCDRCDRRFASVCGRNYHCKSVHGSLFDTKFSETCDHCGLNFSNRVFYAKHVAKLREKPTCYLCWSAFDEDGELKQHMHDVHVDDLPFLCELCHNRFVTLRQLNDHIRSRHAKIRPFKCSYCTHSAVRKDSLEIHIRGCHLGHKPFKCDLCERAFSQSSDLRKHRITHTRSKLPQAKKKKAYVDETLITTLVEKLNPDDVKIEEVVIQVGSRNSKNVTKATASPAVIKPPTTTVEDTPKKSVKSRNRLRICHLCGKNYFTDSGFRHHMVMHRDPNFFCHLCGRVFYESQNLKKHIAAIHSDERPFQCHKCGTKYKRRDVLQEHIKRVHDGVKRSWNAELMKKGRNNATLQVKERYKCPHCEKCMASKAYLKDHINGVHIKEKLYKCNECEMSFTRKASFKYHYHRAHILKKKVLEPRGTFLKDCEYCGLQFQIKKYYEIHVASKHFNKYPCNWCDRVFDNKYHLAKHTEDEHADKLSKCDICGKCFAEDVHLKRHIYLCHTKRTPHECYHCGHKANKKSTLAVHMRRHTGEKPYQCEVCNRRFSQSVDFRKHRANHFKSRAEGEIEIKDENTGMQYYLQTIDVTTVIPDHEKTNDRFETVETVNFVE